MWPFGRKKSARRQEIRRAKSEHRLAWYQSLIGEIRVRATLTTLASAVAAALILNFGSDGLNIRAGQSVPRAITSRLDFRIEDTERTRAMKLQAREGSPNYYRLDVSLLEDIRGRLTSALKLAKEHAGDPQKLRDEAAKIKLKPDAAGLAELLRIAALPSPGEFQNAVAEAIRVLADQTLVEPAELANLRNPAEAVLLDPTSERDRIVPVSQLLFANNPESAETVAAAATQAFAPPLQATMHHSIAAILRNDPSGSEPPVKPVYRFDSERSLLMAQQAEERVPTQHTSFARGSLLTDAGVITGAEHKLLKYEHQRYSQLAHGQAPPAPPEFAPEAEHEAYRRVMAARVEARRAAVLGMLGRTVLALSVVLGLAGYIRRFQPKAAANPLRQAIVAAVLLTMLALARVEYLSSVTPYAAAGAQAFAAGLLTIVYPQGLVFAVCGALAVLMALATQQGTEFLVVLLAISGTLVLGLRDVRQRGKIVAVGAVAGVIAFGIAVAAGLIDRQPLPFVLWHHAAWAGATALAALFIIEGILPGIERLFGLSTSMTLLEWCDASKLPLRRLAAEVPGTYNHSLLVGTLAETACEAIGANGLLARAGAYYHDLGKVSKPEYFVENQGLGTNRHERLSPAMSHLIIIGHVKDGIEMAREYGLPASLRPFIAEHHGTTVVQYFFHAASKARKPGDPEVSETEFRYPGPKPQSRETAILMLCDAVEGAVRAMPEPTPGRIEDTVGNLVRSRQMDGQFDQCDLTFRDLEIVEARLVKSLCSIYHARIVYPAGEKKAPA
ncbi:MAG: HDIG domain-containing protein [Planctomycetes bacterium]|nr:HDIG domain-containing protein [Planctomycetota bacterium]